LINSAIDYNIKDLELTISKVEIEELNFENLKKKFINSGSMDLTNNKIKFYSNKK